MNAKIVVSTVDVSHAYEVAVDENEALAASPIACAVADAWVGLKVGVVAYLVRTQAPSLASALALIEAATRSSPLRKVRP